MKILVLTTIIVIVISTTLIIYSNRHKCLQIEKQMVNHPAWTQFITTSFKPLIMMPVFHPAYSAVEDVCVKRK